jgi:hypothetical protein
MMKPDDCDHCGHAFTTRLDILRIEYKWFRQSKLGSAIEACANTAVGYLIALVCMRIIMWAYDFPMGTKETSIVVFWMTIVSVVRGYVIRRAWNAQFWKSDFWKRLGDAPRRG